MMADWLHKYPGVQALLQQDREDELLGASVETDEQTVAVQGWDLGTEAASRYGGVEQELPPTVHIVHAFLEAITQHEAIYGVKPQAVYLNLPTYARLCTQLPQRDWLCATGRGGAMQVYGCVLYARPQHDPWVLLRR